MPKSPRNPLKLATLTDPWDPGGAPAAAAPVFPVPAPAAPSQPVARFFGVPFLKGAAGEITTIHLCPERIHLAAIRDGSELQVSNRLTLQALDLGDLAIARMVAFRPRAGDAEATELAIAGPMDKADIARYDLRAGIPLAGLPFQGVTALQYSGDGRFVAAGNRTGKVRVWHLGPLGPAPVLEGAFGSQVESLAFHPEHPTVYATLASGALVELELAPGMAAPAGAALRERAPGVLFLRVAAGLCGYSIYLAGQDDRVYVVDTATGEVGFFSPQVGPIAGLQVLPASGLLCVVGLHSVYLLHPVGPCQREHLALVCPFEESVYAAWELDEGAVLVFHAVEGEWPV